MKFLAFRWINGQCRIIIDADSIEAARRKLPYGGMDYCVQPLPCAGGFIKNKKGKVSPPLL